RRIAPPLRVVVLDLDRPMRETACRGPVLPVEVGLDAVVSDAVERERLRGPVDGEGREERIGDPSRPPGRAAGSPGGMLSGGRMRGRRMVPLGPAALSGGARRPTHGVLPTASAIARICADNAANSSG